MRGNKAAKSVEKVRRQEKGVELKRCVRGVETKKRCKRREETRVKAGKGV